MVSLICCYSIHKMEIHRELFCGFFETYMQTRLAEGFQIMHGNINSTTEIIKGVGTYKFY